MKKVKRPKNTIDTLAKQMREGFGSMDRKFAVVDKRFEAVDKRFRAMDKRFDQVEERIDRFATATAEDFVELDDKVNVLIQTQEKLDTDMHNEFTILKRKLDGFDTRISGLEGIILHQPVNTLR